MQLTEDDYLQLSGIQHYAFCKRQWYLIYLEDSWVDNHLTLDGNNIHTRAHNKKLIEKKNGVLTIRGLRLVSHNLCISGECDVVDFIEDDNGIFLDRHDGKFIPFPIEYKRGDSKSLEFDKLQLCAEAICLEEMLLTNITKGALFYNEIHRRIDIEFTKELRDELNNVIYEMFKIINSKYIPIPKYENKCDSCSLYYKCAPNIIKKQSVRSYIKSYLEDEVIDNA